jgi:hypothetical protein
MNCDWVLKEIAYLVKCNNVLGFTWLHWGASETKSSFRVKLIFLMAEFTALGVVLGSDFENHRFHKTLPQVFLSVSSLSILRQ